MSTLLGVGVRKASRSTVGIAPPQIVMPRRRRQEQPLARSASSTLCAESFRFIPGVSPSPLHDVERGDLADEPEHRTMLSDLRCQLDRWLKDHAAAPAAN